MPDIRKPPKWRVPLDELVREFVIAWRLRGDDESASGLVALSRHPRALRTLGQLLGKAGPPVMGDVWRPLLPLFPYAIFGPLARPLAEAEATSRPIIDNLPAEECRRYCAAVELLNAAVFAADRNTRLERHGPFNLSDPGDIVGVKRYSKRSPDQNKAKAVAGKVIGAMFDFYGKPFSKIAITLVKLTTGVELSLDEINTLIERHLASLRTPVVLLNPLPSSSQKFA
jgi:hypothetical protein